MRDVGSGDKLARGCVRATYLVSENRMTDKKWNKIFGGEPEKEKKAVYLFKCPFHGTFASTKEFFLSGGYPKLDELTTSKCLDENCDERAIYAGFQPL